MTAPLVKGRTVRVGDVIAYLGHGFFVARFEPYTGPLSFGGARVAYTVDGRGMTVFDDYPVRLKK